VGREERDVCATVCARWMAIERSVCWRVCTGAAGAGDIGDARTTHTHDVSAFLNLLPPCTDVVGRQQPSELRIAGGCFADTMTMHKKRLHMHSFGDGGEIEVVI
jgi:hypothetical protein